MHDPVRSGAIGSPLFARVFHAVQLPPHLQGWRVHNPQAVGGVVLDITVPDADTLRFVLGAEPLGAVAMTRPDGPVDGGVMAVLRFDDGVLAPLHDAFDVARAGTGIRIHGSRGSIFGRDLMTQRPVGEVRLRDADGKRVLPRQHRSGRRIVAAEVVDGDRHRRITARLFVLGAGAIVSAALLLRSATGRHPRGRANRSDQVGRNEMSEPMLRGPLPGLPGLARHRPAAHRVDRYARSEDLPHPDSRITLRPDGAIERHRQRTNLRAHRRRLDPCTSIPRASRYPIVLAKGSGTEVVSHQCGTLRFGSDPATSALDPLRKA